MDKRLCKNITVSKLEIEIRNKLKSKFKIKPQFRIIDDDKNYFYDIKIDNVLIEIQGLYWHADKRFYKETDIVHNELAKDIWQHDENKKLVGERNNYYILYVYEYDYILNKEKTLNKLMNEIYQFRNN